MKKTIVIGAGIGGLAIAIRLARLGYEVEVYEASSSPGGKLNQVKGNGFRFDAGPSLFTLPELALELLDHDLQFDIKRLPIVARYFWSDGLELDAHSDVDEFCREAELKTGVKPSVLKDYLDEAAEVYHITAPVFIFGSLHKLRSLFRKSNLSSFAGVFRLKAFRSLHRHNHNALRNQKLVQLLDRYATYNGSNPYHTPATLRVIAHLEHNLGAWLPDGGMYTIVKAFLKQLERLHLKIHYNEPVISVDARGDQIRGITTAKGYKPAERVISNMDIYRFYKYLLPQNKKLIKLDRQQRSTSAIIFYWGIRANFEKLDVHNIFFSDNYKEEFVDLFENFSLNEDPTVYLYISSKIFPDDAPEHCENWFVMVNAPENVGQNWDELVKTARKNIIQKLENALSVKLEDKIIFEEVLDPVKVEEKTGSWHGSLYGPSSNSLFSAFKRHPNFSSRIKGLYFTGGSVHPGGGIPLSLSSAMIAASLIENERK